MATNNIPVVSRFDQTTALTLLMLAAFSLLVSVALQVSQLFLSTSFSELIVLFGYVVIELVIVGALLRSVKINWRRKQNAIVQALPESEREWPTVSVIIPCDNEPHHQLEISLIAAKQLNYPREKLRFYLVDNGVSIERRFQGNEMGSTQVNYRYKALYHLCQRLDVSLLEANKSGSRVAKLAEVLAQCDGDYVFVVDPSQIVSGQAVQNLLPKLMAQPHSAVIQAPSYHGADHLVEQRISSIGKTAAFQQSFSLNKSTWSSEFLAGSATLIDKKRLLESDQHGNLRKLRPVVNDQAVSVSVQGVQHSNEAVSKNQQSLLPYLLQRAQRNTEGKESLPRFRVQIEALKSLLPSLVWVFAMIPSLGLLTGITPFISATYATLLAASAFALMCALVVVKYRAFSITELLNHLVNSLIIMIGSARWLTKPPSSRGDSYIPVHKPLSHCLQTFIIIGVVAMITGVVHLVQAGVVRWDLIFLLLVQTLLVGMLFGAFASAQPFSQRRAWPRHSMNMPARCEVAGRRYFCEVVNMSVGGMGIELDAVAARYALQGAEVKVYGFAEKEFRDFSFTCNISSVRKRKVLSLGLAVLCGTDKDYAKMVKMIYGDASRWYNPEQTIDHAAEWKAFGLLASYGAKKLFQQIITACSFRMRLFKKA